MINQTAEEVFRHFEQAFASVEYPGDDDIARVPEDGSYWDDYEGLAADLRGKTWQSLTTEFVLAHSYMVYWLTPRGLKYYLPAYVKVTLSGELVEDSIIPHKLYFALCPPEEPGLLLWFEERMTVFTKEQRQAICHFLQAVPDVFPDLVIFDDSAQILASALAYWCE